MKAALEKAKRHTHTHTKRQDQEFPGSSAGQGFGIVTAMAWVAALAWVQSLAWELPYDA